MSKNTLKAILSVGVMGIGIYMLATYSFPEAPALSGLAFLLAGLGQWLDHCPICARVCKK